MQGRGFTIVEIMVVIVLIVTLTLLGVAGLRSSQVAARDDERQTKTETIARALDNFYRHGDPARSIEPGRYPSGIEMQNAISGGYVTEWLEGVDQSTLQFSWQKAPDDNLEILSTASAPARDQTENAARISSAVTDGAIVYEPLASWVGSRPAGDNDRWASCHDTTLAGTPTCQRFNLYYQKEADSSVVTIRSQNQ